MGRLYRKLNAPNFDVIQKELQQKYLTLDSEGKISHKTNHHYAYPVPYQEVKSLNEFLISRTKCRMPWSKFYITPPGLSWGPHLDGISTDMHRICINIPVFNCYQSKTVWNKIHDEDIKTGAFGLQGGYNTLADEKKSYKIIDETCLDSIMIMRTDVFHDVINNDKVNTRVNFVIRMGLSESMNIPEQGFDMYFNLDGL